MAKLFKVQGIDTWQNGEKHWARQENQIGQRTTQQWQNQSAKFNQDMANHFKVQGTDTWRNSHKHKGHNKKTKSDREQHNNGKIRVQNSIKTWHITSKYRAQTHGETVRNTNIRSAQQENQNRQRTTQQWHNHSAKFNEDRART